MRYIIFILIGSLVGLNAYRLKQIEKIEAQNRTLTEQVNKFNDQIVESNRKLKQANDDYEQAIKKQNVQVKTVKQTIQKIVNRPIYHNICIDSDGLHEINNYIDSNKTASSPDTTTQFK